MSFMAMRAILYFGLLVMVAARDKIEVDPTGGGDGGAGKLDLSDTDLTTKYCESVNRQCKGDDLEAKFAVTLGQCKSRCSRNLECLNLWFSEKRTCHLRSDRCESKGMIDSKGTNLHRLYKGEKCSKDRPLHVYKGKSYGNTFCLLPDKACTASSLYKKPQKIKTFGACLLKCAKIKSCGMVDYKEGACDLKSRMCEDEELSDAPGIQNYLRLEKGVTECPGSRLGPTDPDAKTPPSTTTTTTTTEAPTTTTTTTTTPAPPLTCNGLSYTYCHRPNKDCNGRDIRHVSVSSLKQCQDECDKDCNCKSIQQWGTTCWLKHHLCSNSELINSGVGHDYVKRGPGENCDFLRDTCGGKTYTYCHRPGKDCNGRDIRHVSVSSLKQCQDECDRDCNCKSIQQWGTTCWLKHYLCSNSELINSGVGHDYVKRGPGENCDFLRETCGGKTYTYCHRPNKDCNGRDIRHVRVSSLKQCQAECDKDCNCKSIQQWGTTCWLKHHLCSNSELINSGVGHDYVKRGPGENCDFLRRNTCEGKHYFYCHRAKRDCNGRDLRHVRVSSLKQCQDECDRDCNCKSIQQWGTTCWLKWHECSRWQLIHSHVGHDYVKRAHGERCP